MMELHENIDEALLLLYFSGTLGEKEKEEVEIQIKYEGYIKLQEEQVEKFKKLESKKLSEDIDYEKISSIRDGRMRCLGICFM